MPYQTDISHAATSNLLEILQDFHPDLPSDPITLLHTTLDYELRDITEGSYYHFGMGTWVHGSQTADNDQSPTADNVQTGPIRTWSNAYIKPNHWT